MGLFLAVSLSSPRHSFTPYLCPSPFPAFLELLCLCLVLPSFFVWDILLKFIILCFCVIALFCEAPKFVIYIYFFNYLNNISKTTGSQRRKKKKGGESEKVFFSPSKRRSDLLRTCFGTDRQAEWQTHVEEEREKGGLQSGRCPGIKATARGGNLLICTPWWLTSPVCTCSPFERTLMTANKSCCITVAIIYHLKLTFVAEALFLVYISPLGIRVCVEMGLEERKGEKFGRKLGLWEILLFPPTDLSSLITVTAKRSSKKTLFKNLEIKKWTC